MAVQAPSPAPGDPLSGDPLSADFVASTPDLSGAAPGEVVGRVLGDLPATFLRALDTREAAGLLARLLSGGWRPGQVRARVGSEPAQGSAERDAAHALDVLRALTTQVPPDVAHARAVQERARQRAREREQAPPPASPQARERAIARIRAELKGPAARPRRAVPRLRPECSLCAAEGSYFVTREVHLCRRCVAVLATGEARLSSTA